MGKCAGLGLLLAAGCLLAGCATGDPRLEGTWKSAKVPMPVEMVKVTKMETVRVRKGGKRTRQVPRTTMVAKSKEAPPYVNLILRCERSSITIELPGESDARA